jgi:hypothetical protein
VFAILKSRIIKITLVIFISLLITTCFSQNYKGTIDSVFSIVKQINSDLDSFTKIEKYKDSISFKNYYILNKELKKAEVSTIENGTLKNVSWYFYNSNLIYSERVWLDNKGIKIMDSEKVIVQNNKIIAWLNSSNQLIDFNTNEYNQLCIKLIEFGDYLKNDSLDD